MASGLRTPFAWQSSLILTEDEKIRRVLWRNVPTLKKVKRGRRHSPARFEVSGKAALFPRNDRAYALKYEAFQTENALKKVRRDCRCKLSRDTGNKNEKKAAFNAAFFSFLLFRGTVATGKAAEEPRRRIFPKKARWGRGWGSGGRGANCQTKVETKNTPSSFIFSTVVL